MANEWVNHGDVSFAEYGGNLTRVSEHNPQVVEVFRLDTPFDTGDSYRAFSFEIDLDDLQPRQVMDVLRSIGWVSSDLNVINSEIAKAAGCTMVLDFNSLQKVLEYMGPDLLASEAADYLGTGWCEWETYHDRDEGWNGPWSANQRDDLKPWGQVDPDELTFWMESLGCGAYAPCVSVYERLGEGVVLDHPDPREEKLPDEVYFVTCEATYPDGDDPVCWAPNGPRGMDCDLEAASFVDKELAQRYFECVSEEEKMKADLGRNEGCDMVTYHLRAGHVLAAIEQMKLEGWAWADAGDIYDHMSTDVIESKSVYREEPVKDGGVR